jgi:Fe-S cluster assembly protein SufD
MRDFMQQSLASAERTAPHWLAPIQARGRERWSHAEMPTRKTEQWKYTSLHGLRQDYVPGEPGRIDPKRIGVALPECGGPRIVFVNGHFQESLSRCDQIAGVTLVRFADASPEQAERIAANLGSTLETEAPMFADLTDAAITDGVFIDIEDGAEVEQSIHVVWLTTHQEAAFSVAQRLLVLAGANSQARIIEQFVSAAGEQESFTSGVTELLLAPGATLEHYRLHQEDGDNLHIGRVEARLERDSTLRSFHVGFGSALKRIDIHVQHMGPGAYAQVDGIYLLRGEEHVDYHTCIEHAVPYCTSSETFRGIVGDRASAVFNGRIHIHPDAQKTSAELSNKNLLTSNTAEVNTKPELEIYADDVQCAHGATVAQLDELALHYLRSRGVNTDEAKVMLSFGFINEVVDGFGDPVLQEYLRPMIAHRFSSNPDLARHIA